MDTHEQGLKDKRVAVIGGGPAGLMAAEVMARAGLQVTVFDRMPSLGRKLLLAGRGGLNLTHSEDLEAFLNRYGAARPLLEPAVRAFDPAALRTWSAGLGQETFVGSSGRVFPVAMKASPLLRAWLRRLSAQGVQVRLRHAFLGWDDAGQLLFETPSGRAAIAVDAIILALGGASWPQLGSDGRWVETLRGQGISVTPLTAANCGVLVRWSDVLKARHAGAPLKRIALRIAGTVVRGEAVISAHGLEGGAVYALGPQIRAALAQHVAAMVEIDLKPDETVTHVADRLARPRGKLTVKEHLRRQLNLPPAALALVQEIALARALNLAQQTPEALAALVKGLPVAVTGLFPIARAISTAGGISSAELDTHFMLLRRPGVFAAGEMLDWEAPTGGYLLQACLATGAAAGRGAVAWLSRA